MQIEKEKVVSLDFTLKNSDGEVLDTSADSEPISYLHGVGNMIPGLERELDGKQVGDHLEVSVTAADGYGERSEELVFVVDRDSFNEIEELHTGMQLFMSIEEEDADEEADEAEFTDTLVTVTEISEDSVTVDGNHTLAGVDLHFDVTVRDIRDATEEELAHGHAHGPGSGHDHDDDNGEE